MSRPSGAIVHLVSSAGDDAWERFLDSSQERTIFAGARWMHAAAAAMGVRAEFLLAGHPPAAGSALLLHRRGPLRISTIPPITLYNGVLGRPDTEASDYHAVLASVERTCHFASLALPPGSAAAGPAESRGWEVVEQQTIRIPLSDPDALFRRFSQSLRRKIRRAEEAGLVRVTDVDAASIVSLHEQSYARHGLRPPVDAGRLTGWLDTLLREGIATSHLAADASGRTRAARVIIDDGSTRYDWLAGSESGGAAPAASHWLVWDLVRDAAAHGCAVFDFMGANTSGVSDFKALFGGDLVPYRIIVWRKSRAVRWLERVRRHVTLARRRS